MAVNHRSQQLTDFISLLLTEGSSYYLLLGYAAAKFVGSLIITQEKKFHKIADDSGFFQGTTVSVQRTAV